MKSFRPLSHLTLVSTLIATAGWATPACASLASDTFGDVPNGHWAENGVAEAAIKGDWMRGYADGTFRGDLPFTRRQFAQTMRELIRVLEHSSKSSLRADRSETYTFGDLPPGDERDAILTLANDYDLFDGIPSIQADRFNGDQPITRYEVARSIDNVLRLAEQRGLIRPRADLTPRSFRDVQRSDAAFAEIQAIANHYGVMIGFPDDTFRAQQELTRYQFAQASAQTLPLIRAMVVQTVTEQAHEDELEHHLQGETPWHLEGRAGTSLGGLSLRWVGYPGSFLMSETSVHQTSGVLLDEQLGWSPWAPLVGPVHLQPYLGLRAGAASGGPSAVYGGPGAGLLAYWRFQPEWGLYGNVRGGYMLATSGNAPTLDQLDLQVEYHFQPKLAVTAGFGYWQDPRQAAVPMFKAGLSWGM